MMAFRRTLLVVALSLGLAGCGPSAEDLHSGTADNDYVEEPLTELTAKWEQALDTSNEIMGLLKDDAISDVYDTYAAEALQSSFPESRFTTMIDQVSAQAGPLTRFKKMQWKFTETSVGGHELLLSTKIAEHESRIIEYQFMFMKDGAHDEIVGFNVIEKPAG